MNKNDPESVELSLVRAEKIEILVPTRDDVQEFGQSTSLFWTSIAYNIAAFNMKKGNAMGGERYETEHVFGRCLGERSDGKTFFATTILPWIWDESYDWRKIARERLETFLDPQCRCDSREEETRVCEYHLSIMTLWESDDRGRMWNPEEQEKLAKLPPAEGFSGVFSQGIVMNRDYPWCREVTQNGITRWMCTICGFGKDPKSASFNPTYRNIFIRDHSHCGFKNPPPTVEELVREKKKQDEEVIARLNDQFLNPKTPSPGHAAGCVCHRCRIAAENSEKVRVLDSPVYREEKKCSNCKRGVYRSDGRWWHTNLFRTCDLTGFTEAEA